jgi:hypothetical protein
MNEEDYEVFGRRVDFDTIPVYSFSQPGIIDSENLFDTKELRERIRDLAYLSPTDIEVYFNNIAGKIEPKSPADDRPWVQTFQDFLERLDNFPAGRQVLYYHGNGSEKARVLPVIDARAEKGHELYQAGLNLFDGALVGFSCFVRGNEEGMSLESVRNNYEEFAAGKDKEYHHDGLSRWAGRSDIFVQAAARLANTIERTDWEYTREFGGRNQNNPEIRIIAPGRGALVSRLVRGSGATIRVTQKGLEESVRKYRERQEQMLRAS